MSNAVTTRVSVRALTHAPNPKSQELLLLDLKRQSFSYVTPASVTFDDCSRADA